MRSRQKLAARVRVHCLPDPQMEQHLETLLLPARRIGEGHLDPASVHAFGYEARAPVVGAEVIDERRIVEPDVHWETEGPLGLKRSEPAARFAPHLLGLRALATSERGV